MIVDNQTITTEEKIIKFQGNNNIKEKPIRKKSIANHIKPKKNLYKILIILLILVFVGLIIFLSIFLTKRNKKNNEIKNNPEEGINNGEETPQNEKEGYKDEQEEDKNIPDEDKNKNEDKEEDKNEKEENKNEKNVNDQEEDIAENKENKNSNILKEDKEAMTAFEPTFKINSIENQLNQILLKSTQKYTTILNGNEASYSIYTKAKYDIFTIDKSSSIEDKDFYNNKYKTIITLNSQCSEYISNSQTDCELKQYLDLTQKSSKNLRLINEVDEDIIKNAILPFCIIEHTESNIILSISCPETLSLNFKNDIMLAFKSIKLDTIKGIIENKDNNTLADIKLEEKENKIYIESFKKGCDDLEGDLTKKNCEVKDYLITDKEGNLISIEKNILKNIDNTTL